MNLSLRCENCTTVTRELCEAMYSVHLEDAQTVALNAWERGDINSTTTLSKFITDGVRDEETLNLLGYIGCSLTHEQIIENIGSLTRGK